jgi:hypothetical protein
MSTVFIDTSYLLALELMLAVSPHIAAAQPAHHIP